MKELLAINQQAHEYALKRNADPTTGDYVYARTDFVAGAKWFWESLTVIGKKQQHPIQKNLLKIMRNHDLTGMTLRQIGSLIGVDHPQQVKHHLNQIKASIK